MSTTTTTASPTSPRAFRLACVQLHTGTDLDANYQQCATLIRRAVEHGGARVVVTPENTHRLAALTMPAHASQVHTEARHPILRRYRALAIELRVWIVLGSMAFRAVEDEHDDHESGDASGSNDANANANANAPSHYTGKLVNRSLCIAPYPDPHGDDATLGAIVARYDKIHLFDVPQLGSRGTTTAAPAAPPPPIESYLESARVQAGTSATVVHTPLATFGLSVCYDVRFPHLYRALAHAGAHVLCVPAAFTVVTGRAHWHTLLRARAIETGCYVIAPAQCGTHPGDRKTYGHSLVVDPWGEIVAEGVGIEEAEKKKSQKAIPRGAEAEAEAEDDPFTDLLLVDIDLDRVDEARRRIPSLTHDRPFQVVVAGGDASSDASSGGSSR